MRVAMGSATHPSRMLQKHAPAMLLAVAATLPGIFVRLAGIPLDPAAMAFTAGAAILGAAFLLLWACDAAQTDISQGLALAAVALMAVLPEYAVDMYFTWRAGKDPAGGYAQYAIANMTGANRLLIGVGWGLVAAICWFRFRRPARIERERRMELLFLGAATAWAFVIPIKGSLAWYDGLVFLLLYGWYIAAAAARRRCPNCEAGGPAELLVRLPAPRRRMATAALFLFAGAAILANAEPFCEGLLGAGRAFGIDEFLLVQWLAPLASEAPEFTVALAFAWRGQTGMALGALLSAKLSQWTLLVGMIPGVYALSSGSLAQSIPLSGFQMSEVLLTAAQSLLAVLLLAGLRLPVGAAMMLFGLFAGQLLAPLLAQWMPALVLGLKAGQIRPAFTALYLAAAAALLVDRPGRVTALVGSLRREPAPAPAEEPPCAPEYPTPRCATCQFRQAAEAPRAMAHAAGR
jgi:cation:H+ antiporter